MRHATHLFMFAIGLGACGSPMPIAPPPVSSIAPPASSRPASTGPIYRSDRGAAATELRLRLGTWFDPCEGIAADVLRYADGAVAINPHHRVIEAREQLIADLAKFRADALALDVEDSEGRRAELVSKCEEVMAKRMPFFHPTCGTGQGVGSPPQ